MRFKDFKHGQEDLFEVNMGPSNLAKLVKGIKGVQIGLEFEMIVPDVGGDDGDMEPNYDEDERVEDIDDACNFFDDGDHNSNRMIRELRSEMEDEYQNWKMEQIDEDWANNGYEFFMEFLDREDAFDRYDEDTLEDAENYVREQNPELDPGTDEYQQAVSERMNELEAAFIQNEWEDQGEWYNRAKEEFDDDHSDDYSERDWMRSEGLRYASDVQNHFSSDVIWPYWTNQSGGEADIKDVALVFMNDSGLPYTSVVVGEYHGYGGYQRWNGSSWDKIGNEKPNDCFTIEPDGSLDGDNPGDRGLEFVSPPIPLEQIGDVMSKVQKWAGRNGVYTGANNATSMHTNISIPGYSIEKLDYVKAALLLGDEHVLREFDRIGNTYAKPAIEKVKQLARDKPEKTKELLDTMKTHLNAAASKILHSGVTDKYTSINTKDNRIEFRSPGGDYLSIIGDNPEKMINTINRMVVAMDAALDPEKYKEEYQKKLYKVLTGDIGSRKGKTGEQGWTITSKANVWDKDTRRQMPAFKTDVEAKTAKDAWEKVKANLPADATQSEYNITPNKIPTPGNKDLLNIFSRYAAGEMPKAALKSFLKQAQLQRKMERDPTGGQKYWWNVRLGGQRVEVVATSKKEAFDAALDTNPEWMRYNINQAEITPLRPYVEEPAQRNGGLYKIFSASGQLIAGDEYGSDEEALGRAAYWAQRRGVDVVVRNAEGQEVGRVSASGEITPTAPVSTANHNWCIRNRDTQEVLKTFYADGYSQAHEVLVQYKDEHNITDNSLTYGPYNPAEEQSDPVPGSTLDLQRQRAARADAERELNQPSWFVRPTGQPGREIQLRASSPREALARARGMRSDIFGDLNDNQIEVRSGEAGSRSEPVNISPPRAQTGIWGIWANIPQQFAQTNSTPGSPLRRFETRDAAQAWLDSTALLPERFNVRVIPPNYQRPAPQTPGQGDEYEMYRISDGRTVTGPSGNEIRFRATSPAAAEEMRDRYANQFNLGAPQLFDVRSVLNAPQQQPQQSAVNTPPPNAGMSGNWGLWMTNADRFARWPGYPTAAGQEIPLRRFETKAAAEEYLNSLRETNPRVRTDVEVREIEPERTPVSDINLFHDIPTQANANWEIVRDRGNQVVARFRASDQDNAIGLANTYIRSQGWNIDDYTVQAIEQDASQFREPSDSRGNLTPRGPGPWEIYRLSDGSSVRELAHTNRNAAESEARSALGLRGEAPELYGVRTRQQSQGGNEVGDRYTPTGSGEFTGQWFILDPDNIIIYKFGGIGNSQSDANRHAMNWLTRNPRQMVDGVTVVPEMG